MLINCNFNNSVKPEVYNLSRFKYFIYNVKVKSFRCLIKCGLPSADIFPCGGTAESRRMRMCDF